MVLFTECEENLTSKMKKMFFRSFYEDFPDSTPFCFVYPNHLWSRQTKYFIPIQTMKESNGNKCVNKPPNKPFSSFVSYPCQWVAMPQPHSQYDPIIKIDKTKYKSCKLYNSILGQPKHQIQPTSINLEYQNYASALLCTLALKVFFISTASGMQAIYLIVIRNHSFLLVFPGLSMQVWPPAWLLT